MIFYLVNVDYERQTGEDNPGKVKESYLVEAPTPSDAEHVVLDEIKPFIFGDCTTTKIQKVQFFEVFNAEKSSGVSWYKAKAELITIDGDKEVRNKVSILVQSDGEAIDSALMRLQNNLTSYDCEILSIAKTPIIDILKMEV